MRLGHIPDKIDMHSTAKIAVPNSAEANSGVLTRAELKARERDNILAALENTNWKIYGTGGAAELLGLKSTTLASRLKSLQIRKPNED